jgi:uncharacterized protein (TIGR00730 family)
MAQPSYLIASEDLHFLDSDEVRGIRLEMDYLKAELLFQRHGVDSTIVVFGGTRLCEHKTAQRRVDELKAAVLQHPDDAKAQRDLAVAHRILEKSGYYEVARDLGSLIANENKREPRKTLVMTGGGPGIMEAANRGAFDVNAKSIGLNISLPHEQFPNPYVTPDLCFQFHYFAMRKLHFLHRARALVAFPGGFGTFDELFEVLTLIQTRKIKPIPVILVGYDFWRRAIDIDFLVEEGVIDEEDRDLFWFAETAPSIWTGLLEWEKRTAAAAAAGSDISTEGSPS